MSQNYRHHLARVGLTMSQQTAPTAVSVHIERLVLHDFPATGRWRIGPAVQGELARVLAKRGLPSGLAPGGAFARMDGQSFRLAPGAGAEDIGRQVAHAIYRGLVR